MIWVLAVVMNGQLIVNETYPSKLDCEAAQTRLLGQIVQAKARGEVDGKDYQDRLDAVSAAKCEQQK
jgi:hypothetical protein